MATNYGQDSYCLTDVLLIDTQVIDPRILIGQRIARMLQTPRGALANIGDDADWGWSVLQLINARIAPSQIAQYESQIESECTKDEEVASASVTISGSSGSYTISVQVTSSSGPFTLVLPVADLSASQIFLS